MTRVGLTATALSGLVAGFVGAETTVTVAPYAPDPRAFVFLAAAGALLAAVTAVRMRRADVGAARPRIGPRNARAVRRRVLSLVRDGAAPDRIVRDTGLPLDLVLLAMHAGRRSGGAMPHAAIAAGPQGDEASAA